MILKRKLRRKNKKHYRTKGYPSLRRVTLRGQTRLYQADSSSIFFNELRNLVLKAAPPSFPKIEKSLLKLGRLKLVLLTGVFLNLPDSRIDLMVVGDDINFRKLGGAIKNMEKDLGSELRYVILGTDEFKYRYEMFDRFVRDILDAPHKKIIDRLRGGSW